MAIPRGLFSRIVPNYGSDNFGDVIRTLRLTIVRELTGDGMEQELLLPVPTATWRDFAGAPPYTAIHRHADKYANSYEYRHPDRNRDTDTHCDAQANQHPNADR